MDRELLQSYVLRNCFHGLVFKENYYGFLNVYKVLYIIYWKKTMQY